MAYGTVKVDTIIFDQGGADQNVTVSGIYRAITSGVTVSGTISGAVLIGTTTVSGATVTGTQSSFTSGNFVTLSGVTATFTSGVIASGTAAAPSLSIVSDPNTGLYSPGADQVALATAGAGRLFVDSSGRVGIGNSSPTYALDIAGSPGVGLQILETVSANTRRLRITQETIGVTYDATYGTGDNAHRWLIGGTERVRIDSSGRVGIGTGAPGVKLDVVSIPINVSQSAISARFGTGDNTYDLRIQNNTDASGNPFVVIKGPDGGLMYTSFEQGGVERLRIDSSGRVGIGTTSPGSILTVNDPGTGLQFANAASGNYNIGLLGGTGSADAYVFNRANSPLILGTNNTERLRIDSSGNVGIGTSSPRSVLDVSGTSGITWIDGSNSTKGLLTVGTQGTSGGSLFVHTPSLNVNYGSGFAVDGSYSNPGGIGTSVVNLKALGVFSGGGYDSALTFHTSVNTTSSEKVRIDSSGRVGIGTSAPGANHVVEIVGNRKYVSIYPNTGSEAGALGTVNPSSSSGLFFGWNRSNGEGESNIVYGVGAGASPYLQIASWNGITYTERLRIDSSGRLLVATSSPRTISSAFMGGGGATAEFQVEGQFLAIGSFSSNRNDSFGPYLAFVKSRGTTANSFTLVNNGDVIGALSFNGTDGSAALAGAAITALVEGTPGANDMPGCLVFSTTADGASIPTERLRISSSGNVGIGTSSPAEKLQVDGNIALDNSVLNTPKYIHFRANAVATEYGGIKWYNFQWNSTVRASITSGPDGAVASGYLAFSTGISGLDATEQMRIDSSGRVGIGTSAPQSKLDLGLGTDGARQISWHTDASTSYANIWSSYNGARTTIANGLKGSTTVPNGFESSVSALWGRAATEWDYGKITFYTAAPSTVAYGTAITPSERMRIDSSGNVGIGTSLPVVNVDIAPATSAATLRIQARSITSPVSTLEFLRGTSTTFAGDAYTDWRITDNSIGDLTLEAGSTSLGGIFERLRVNDAGRLLFGHTNEQTNSAGAIPRVQVIGTSGSDSSFGAFRFSANALGASITLAKSRSSTIGTQTVVAVNDLIGSILFNGSDGTQNISAASFTAEVDGTPGTNDMPGRLVFSTTANGAASPTERMRITNGGNVLFNATAVVEQGLVLISYNGGVNQGAIFAESDTTSGNTAIRFKVAGSTVGSITTTSSATAYNTSSDYRLKENVTAVTDGITRLQQLKPSRFNFIVDPDHTVDGFIAHEVQDIVPEAITGEKDAVDDKGNPVYQGIDQSKMLPLVVAALQECVKRIESLESELALLKNKPYLGN